MECTASRSVAVGTVAWALVLLTCVVGGCGRAFYRQQADADAYCLVDSKATNPHWPLDDFTIQLPAESRMYDPFDPDFPPLPPDDPHSHQLMHCVYCKPGYPCWHANGDTPYVANPYWESYLCRDADGRLMLDIDGAVRVARLHSTDFQSQLEELYLSALDVSFERFRFDAQFFGGLGTSFTADGPARPGGGGQSRSVLAAGTAPASSGWRMNKLFATGGELVVG
ncbi:MAG: hypothetical protein KDA99_25500, partial [Planctomycetales bacterium]|nr:hypothetical protein [Planctomycetales bacterium]